MTDVNKAIAMTVKTGKVFFGSNNAIRSARVGRARLIVVAENCPPQVRKDIEYYCKLSNVPLLIYNGTSKDLGVVCGKAFTVSALTIREQGDSDILNSVEIKNV